MVMGSNLNEVFPQFTHLSLCLSLHTFGFAGTTLGRRQEGKKGQVRTRGVPRTRRGAELRENRKKRSFCFCRVGTCAFTLQLFFYLSAHATIRERGPPRRDTFVIGACCARANCRRKGACDDTTFCPYRRVRRYC